MATMTIKQEDGSFLPIADYEFDQVVQFLTEQHTIDMINGMPLKKIIQNTARTIAAWRYDKTIAEQKARELDEVN